MGTEVFQGKPTIVSVTISGEEGQREYHVAGRGLIYVADSVRAALAALKDEFEPVKAKKQRRKRRTKAEMMGETEPAPEGVAPSHRRHRKEEEPVQAENVWPK